MIDRTKALRMVRGLTSVALHAVGGPAVIPLRVVQVVGRQPPAGTPQEARGVRVLRVGLGRAGVFGPGEVLGQGLDACERQQSLGCRENNPAPAAEQGEPLPGLDLTPAAPPPAVMKLDGPH
jgi:hypothetical protein